MAENKNIYVDAILNMIKDEVDYILTHDDIYKAYKNSVVICDEQIFAQQDHLTPKTIYLVTKFGNASFDFGQALVPITINAVSEQNGLEICQRLLFDLATQYTQSEPINSSDFNEDGHDNYVKQIWNTPNVINNFNEVSVGFRSLMYMTGTVLIGHDSSPIVELNYNYDEVVNGETVHKKIELHKYMITFSDSFDIYPDTQAFYNTYGIGKTAAKTASYAFSITLFKVSNAFMTRCRNIKRGNITAEEQGISTKFNISMRDKDEPEGTYFTENYTLINMTIQQNKGELPTVALTFAR